MENKEVSDAFMAYDVLQEGHLAPAINADGRKKKLLFRSMIIVAAIVGICCIWTSSPTNTPQEEETVNLMIRQTNRGLWGTWKKWRYLPPGTFACGAKVKYEKNQGSEGDDTAVNGLDLAHCAIDNHLVRGNTTIWEGDWGSWTDMVYCN